MRILFGPTLAITLALGSVHPTRLAAQGTARASTRTGDAGSARTSGATAHAEKRSDKRSEKRASSASSGSKETTAGTSRDHGTGPARPAPAATTAGPATAPGAGAAVGTGVAGGAGPPAAAATAVAPTGPILLRDAPDGQPLASLTTRTTLEPIAHDRGWVRVRAEGWVRESDVSAVNAGQTSLSAADLRADPDAARGRTVRWGVEILAMEAADPLRKGLDPDQPFLLARGPGQESALLYIAVPPGLAAAARALASAAPLAVDLVATVRAGRSEPTGVPILEAQSLARR